MTSSRICLLYAFLVTGGFVSPAEAIVCTGSAAFNITSELRADGSIALKIDYSKRVQGLRRVNFEKELAGVKYEKSKRTHRTTLNLSFEDVEAMREVPAVQSFELHLPELGQSGNLRRLRFDSRPIKMQAAHMRIGGVADDYLALCWKMHLPGDVVKSNASNVEGRTATWVLTIRDFWDLKDPIFEVTFEESSDESAVAPD